MDVCLCHAFEQCRKLLSVSKTKTLSQMRMPSVIDVVQDLTKLLLVVAAAIVAAVVLGR